MSATVFEKNGSTLVVKPEGLLDAEASPVLEKELQLYTEDVQEIIVDFANVEYITSSGLRVLLATELLMKERNGSLRLIHVNESIIEVFELVGFMDVVTVERESS